MTVLFYIPVFSERCMCYILIISTDMPKDLACYNQDNLFFEKIENPTKEISKLDLIYPNRYEVSTMQPKNCSCYLRIFDQHLAKEIGFCQLQDWLDEQEDEDIINTRLLLTIIKDIINQGFKVDSYLSWNYIDTKETERLMPDRIQVNVNQIDQSHFALFEGVYFDYITANHIIKKDI